MGLELRAVIHAILYMLRTGCQWRYVPRAYPNDNSVDYHYHKGCWDGTWARVRQQAGREAQPNLAIIDTKTCENDGSWRRTGL